jgi:putative transposase
VEVSARTVGRIMAVHRNLYGLEKPKRGPHRKKRMPFEATRRHQIWTADVRYIQKHRLPVKGYLYVISILENYSRKILASAVCRKQDLASFLPVLHSAIERYGSPETFVTDSGSVFLANRAREVYEALGMEKVEIEKGKPWQSFIETTLNIQRKMADYHFGRAESWQELVDAHDRWVGDYNAQRHRAHERREDRRCSPESVLGFYTGVRYHPEDLRRALFESRHDRVLDALGYARLMHWRIFGHEGLARRDVALWLSGDTLSVEHEGETLSRYEVEYRPGHGSLGRVRCLELFEGAHGLPQPRLFGLEEALGDGWLKALKLDGYAPRRPRGTEMLQQILFPYAEAL